jgi:small subunit ribosomal protein S7
MPRRRRPDRRDLPADPKFGSVLVSRFINNVMRKGKRGRAETIFYNAIDILNNKSGSGGEAEAAPATGGGGLSVFEKAINNVKPALEVKPRRVGGATFQIPIEVSPDRKIALAIRWIIQSAKARNEHTMQERLAEELLSASKREGTAYKKREDTHRMAEANKAFAHFRW